MQNIEQLPSFQGSDADFFAMVTKVVFYTGFTRTVVEKRWPAFVDAFLGFDIDQVASFDDVVIERLLCKDSLIIKNHRKVRATVENARVCLRLREEVGSLAEFANSILIHGEENGEKVLRKTFHLIGESAGKSLYNSLVMASQA